MPFLPSELSPSTGLASENLSDSSLLEQRRRRKLSTYWAIITLIAFVSGSAGGYMLGSRKHNSISATQTEIAELAQQVNSPKGYSVSTTFGDIGPKLLQTGAIKREAFIQVYEKAGQPLNGRQLAILEQGSPAEVIFNRENAYFLLNFFWALGLANDNPLLIAGPMMRNGREKVVNYASTGGWSLSNLPVSDLYASASILTLTAEQQARLEAVVRDIYRPCCDNPTTFPDCNHGMAMLGLMELMASQGASADEMFRAAKYANAYWYPQQSFELAAYFKAAQKADFAQADARQLVSMNFSSLSGYRNVHQWLSNQGLLQQAPSGGSSCGV